MIKSSGLSDIPQYKAHQLCVAAQFRLIKSE